MEGSSRIETARRRVRLARVSIGATAAAGFLVFALAARASHAGTHHTQVSSAAGSRSGAAGQSQGGFSFGSGSISPSSGGSPTVQSGGS